MSKDLKLCKAQLSKLVQLGGFLGEFISYLGKISKTLAKDASNEACCFLG